ncbi:hypothetical protein [Cytobacillus praedii]|uniref:hypothetical protein n=1 Tax=Cytobacillus praedii TaxID=1742358 RepID=UPI002E1F4119|nr:hypothetical protein [Cytobacillus praedii]
MVGRGRGGFILRNEDPNSIGERKKVLHRMDERAPTRSENEKKVLHRMDEGPNLIGKRNKVLHSRDESPNSIGKRKKGPSSKG